MHVTYIEMDSDLLRVFDLYSETYFQSMENAQPLASQTYRKIITDAKEVITHETYYAGEHTYHIRKDGM